MVTPDINCRGRVKGAGLQIEVWLGTDTPETYDNIVVGNVTKRHELWFLE